MCWFNIHFILKPQYQVKKQKLKILTLIYATNTRIRISGIRKMY